MFTWGQVDAPIDVDSGTSNMLAGGVWSWFGWIQIWHHVVGYQFRWKYRPLVGCPIDFHRLSICLIDFFTANWILFVCSLEIASFLFLFCTYLALYYIGLLLLPVNVNQLFLRKLSVTLKKIFNLTGLCFPHLLNGGGGSSLDCLETGENSLCLVGGEIGSVGELSPWTYINIRLRVYTLQ